MGIQVTCPNGHTFKVKDKYAGKKGLCPQCPGQVVVQVPALQSQAAEDAYRKAVIQEHKAPHAAPPPSPSSSSVLDDAPSEVGSSTSHIGSSVLRHNVRCECGAAVPMWFARCPSCGKYLEH